MAYEGYDRNIKTLGFLKLIKELYWETTIWFSTTTLKTSLHIVMSNAIKDLNVSFSLLIDFEVKWQSSLSDKLSKKKIKEFSRTIMTNKQQTPINCALCFNLSLHSKLWFLAKWIVLFWQLHCPTAIQKNR